MPQITLRHEVRPQDAADVQQLVAATGFFTQDEVAIARELVETTLTQGPAGGYSFVFADAQALAGYTCFGQIPATEGRYDLYWIAVSPAIQRGGVGRRLLQESEVAIRRAGGVRVYIETSSQPKYEPTRGFYLSAGYEVAACLSGFYRDGDDKVIYRKIL